MVGIDPALLAALVTQESGGNPAASSADGGVGLTQLTTPSYVQQAAALAKQTTGVANAYDPISNLTVGAEVLKQNLIDFGFNFSSPSSAASQAALRAALDAYNAGEGAVKGALAAGENPDMVTTNGNYGSSVLALYKEYVSKGVFGSSWPTSSIATTPPAEQGYTQPTGTGNQASLLSLPGDLGGAVSSADQNLKTFLAGMAGEAVSPATSAVTTGLSGLANLAQDWGKQVGKWLVLAIIGLAFLFVLDQLVTGHAPQPVPV